MFSSPNVVEPIFDIIRPVLRDKLPGTREAAMAFLREDIRENRLGVSGSALKYALEALLDARVFVKSLADFRHDAFSDTPWIYRTFSSLVNRNVIGPQTGKNVELLSLLSDGLVQIAPAGSTVTARDGRVVLSGPSADEEIAVDYLIRADQPNCATPRQATFINELVALGAAMPILDPEGLLIGFKVDRDMRLLPRDPHAACPLWAIGPVCEGSSYYNNYVPCIQHDAEYPYFEANRIPPSALTKDLLGRMIAWRIQERFYGGHDKATIKLLDGLARGEALKIDTSPRLKPGTVLMREHRGVRHTVTVVPNGFVWQERTYASLSTIARAITGTSWNGPRFFGLRIKGEADQVEAGQ